MVQKNSRQSRTSFRHLFFLKHRPHLWGVTQEWEPPAEEDVYQKKIYDDGFVSSKYDQNDEIDLLQHPVILQDLKDLDQILLPVFLNMSNVENTGRIGFTYINGSLSLVPF